MSIASLFTRIPTELLRSHRVVPLKEEAEAIQFGVCMPPDAGLLDELAFLLGKEVMTVQMSAESIDALLSENLPEENGSPIPEAQTVSSKLVPGNRGSVVQQVDALIASAIRQHASDIHIEPYETCFRVRYRLDGVLHSVCELVPDQRDAIISRLKIMSALDIAEKRRPQDGRIRFEHAGATIDLRVSTLPTDFGEKVVLRILDRSSLCLDLQMLGLSSADLDMVRDAIHLPFGMILVTGPTGSGKTTTLYAALNEMNNESINITTIEDPIEYNLWGINQTHVRADIGLTFAHALRTFLRQDPNVIMVGEMRDKETVEIAVRAALTGHLVLSTMHTNDAPSTVVRLMDMGVEPFLVADSVKLLVAQRLVRKICKECRSEYFPDSRLVDRLGIGGLPAYLFTGEGCEQCNGTGFRGRTAIFEVMSITEELAELITCRMPIQEIRKMACRQGMRTLREVAVEKMLAGVTTIHEVLRETTR